MREPAPATLTLVQEPSGEVRVALKIPARSQGHGNRDAARQLWCASRAPLVHSDEVRENVRILAGHGKLPSDTMFSRHAKRKVKNLCATLETSYGKNISFGTLTLKGSTEPCRRAFAIWSAKIVELIDKWRKYHAPESEWVYKWEWQTSGALHLHFAIGSKERGRLRTLERSFKRYANRLHDTISRLAGMDICERMHGGSWANNRTVTRSRIERVRKSVKRYMAKYLTKGEGAKVGYSPSRWWGCSKSLVPRMVALRRIVHLRSEAWELLVRKLAAIETGLSTSVVTRFSYRVPGCPHDKTLLFYPDEGDVKRLYLEICRLCGTEYSSEPLDTAGHTPVWSSGNIAETLYCAFGWDLVAD